MDNKDSVITLQLGHYANFVGAHYWNIQEAGFVYCDGGGSDVTSSRQLEVNHGVLFREGKTRHNEVTFTPRLVSVDLKNALGSLPICGDLYEKVAPPSADDVTAKRHWAGDVMVTKEEERGKSEYLKHLDQQEEDVIRNGRQDDGASGSGPEASVPTKFDLDSQVRVWSDFLRTRYHPKTNVVVGDYYHDDLTVNPFDVFGLGYHCNAADVLEEIEDRVRFFAEESDSLRGFHLLCDNQSGFGGLSVRVAEMLAEDYGSKTVLGFPLSPSHPTADSAAMKKAGIVPAIHCTTMFLNGALTLNGLSQTLVNGMVTPLSVCKDTFPLLKSGPDHVRSFANVSYDAQSSYHSSAVLAASLDVLTLPWRSYNPSAAPMASLASELNRGGRKLASLAASQPLPVRDCLITLLGQLESQGQTLNDTMTSLTPGCNDVTSKIDMQMVSLRGVDRSSLTPARLRPTGKYAMIDEVYDVMSAHYEGASAAGVLTRSVFTANAPLPVGCPFPQIFDGQKLSSVGFLLSDPSKEVGRVDSVPAVTAWQSSGKGIGQSLSKMAERASKLNLNKLPKFLQAGLEHDALEQAVEELTELSECYQDRSY